MGSGHLLAESLAADELTRSNTGETQMKRTKTLSNDEMKVLETNELAEANGGYLTGLNYSFIYGIPADIYLGGFGGQYTTPILINGIPAPYWF
jgi:hypothetical protein